MARMIGNGLNATLTISSTDYVLPIQSISIESGERPEVDMTAANDAQRTAVPGLRSVLSGSMTCILDSGQITALEASLVGCTTVGLVVNALQADCSTQVALIASLVYVSSFSVSTSMDEAVTVDISFFYAGEIPTPDPE